MNKKQTAVEWLFDKISDLLIDFSEGNISAAYYGIKATEYKYQAKQMEKEQITDAICEGIQQFVVEFNEAKNTFTISYPDPNMIAEQYYNETYNP